MQTARQEARHTFWGLCGVFWGKKKSIVSDRDLLMLCIGAMLTVRKLHGQLELATLPDRLLLARNTALPVLEIEDTLRITSRPRIEPKRVISTPELAASPKSC